MIELESNMVKRLKESIDFAYIKEVREMKAKLKTITDTEI